MSIWNLLWFELDCNWHAVVNDADSSTASITRLARVELQTWRVFLWRLKLSSVLGVKCGQSIKWIVAIAIVYLSASLTSASADNNFVSCSILFGLRAESSLSRLQSFMRWWHWRTHRVVLWCVQLMVLFSIWARSLNERKQSAVKYFHCYDCSLVDGGARIRKFVVIDSLLCFRLGGELLV